MPAYGLSRNTCACHSTWGGIAHFRVGDVVLIEDVGPRLALVTGVRHKHVPASLSKLLAHTKALSA